MGSYQCARLSLYGVPFLSLGEAMRRREFLTLLGAYQCGGWSRRVRLVLPHSIIGPPDPRE